MSASPNPYIGPRPFTFAERNRFFGREIETRRLRDNVLAHGIVMLYGISGTGKSSLLNTKLREVLETEDGFEVLPIARVKGFIADGRYPDGIGNVFVFNVVAHVSGGDAGAHARASLEDFLAARQRKLDAFGEPSPRLLIVDQFEELLTTHDEYHEHRRDFFRQLVSAARDPSLRILLSLREDYLAAVMQYADVFQSTEARIQLPALTLSGALAAVSRPTEGSGRAYGDGVANELVRNLSTKRIRTEGGVTLEIEGETVEPVQLQVVCQRLWDKTESAVISLEEMRRFGDVDAALLWFYEETLAFAVSESGVDERQLRDWFDSHLITAADTRGMVIEDRGGAEGMPMATVSALERKHLIRAERRHGARWFELTHDRLIKPIQTSNRTFREKQRDIEDPVRQARFLLRDRLNRGATLTRDEYRQVSRFEEQLDWSSATGGDDALRWSPAELMLRSSIRLLSRTDFAVSRRELRKWTERVRAEHRVLEGRDVPVAGELLNRQQLQALGDSLEVSSLTADQLAFVVASLLRNADDGQQGLMVRFAREWTEKRVGADV